MDNKENQDKEGAEKITSRRSDLGGRLCFTLSRFASSGPKSFKRFGLIEGKRSTNIPIKHTANIFTP